MTSDGDMPYKPIHGPGRCDLCGQRGALERVELSPGHELARGERKDWIAPRVAYVCSHHPDRAGDPVRSPRQRMRTSTSRKRPQSESLFEQRPAGPYETND